MTEIHDTDEDHMVKIDKLIADMQSIRDRFGNTCVYIRRGGLSWGAVALNRRDDDEKHGVFDLQAQHDRDMLARLEQIDRLKHARNTAEQAANSLRAEHDAAARDMRERCAKVAEEKAQEFRSPEYAVNQPFSSTAERFACAEVAKAIRAMPETDGSTGTVIATDQTGGAT